MPMPPLRASAVALTLLAAALLSSCGTATASSSDVEDQIVSTLKDTDGNGVDSADCPDDLEGTVDQSMTCTATVGDQTFDVEVKVTSVDGSDIKFDITPQQ